MKVLLLGAAGRTGAALVRSLHQQNHTVVAFVRNLATFPPELASLCETAIVGDARMAGEIEAAVLAHDCDAVVNAAGYTPMRPGVKTDLPQIFEGTLRAAMAAGRSRSRTLVDGDGEDETEAGDVQRDKRVRVWLFGDVSVMDAPWEGYEGVLLKNFLPPIFPIHRETYPILLKYSTNDVAWTLMCPEDMVPEKKDNGLSIVFNGPTPPGWTGTLLWLPLIGKYVNAFINAVRMQSRYCDVTDYIATDLLSGLESTLVGRKVSPGWVPRD